MTEKLHDHEDVKRELLDNALDIDDDFDYDDEGDNCLDCGKPFEDCDCDCN